MPDLPKANTHLTTVAIAERLIEKMRSRYRRNGQPAGRTADGRTPWRSPGREQFVPLGWRRVGEWCADAQRLDDMSTASPRTGADHARGAGGRPPGPRRNEPAPARGARALRHNPDPDTLLPPPPAGPRQDRPRRPRLHRSRGIGTPGPSVVNRSRTNVHDVVAERRPTPRRHGLVHLDDASAAPPLPDLVPRPFAAHTPVGSVNQLQHHTNVPCRVMCETSPPSPQTPLIWGWPRVRCTPAAGLSQQEAPSTATGGVEDDRVDVRNDDMTSVRRTRPVAG